MMGHPPQFFMDKRDQLVQRRLIPVAPLNEQLGEFL
jgi:hypothetical protein